MASSNPHTLIHVRNLQTHLPISVDAWGRSSSSQPVLISLSASLLQPFSSASSQDQVTNSTIHYGILSKGVLSYCDQIRKFVTDAVVPMTLEVFTSGIIISLFGAEPPGTPVLSWDVVESLDVKVVLPKASLLGKGVEYRLKATRPISEASKNFEAQEQVLTLRDLQVPCIIGVNPHERKAKQVVLATVSIENFHLSLEGRSHGTIVELERAVVSAIEPSSFQTLEALTTHLANAIVKDYLASFKNASVLLRFPRIRVVLEKPTAVTFADAPAVEVLVETDPALNEGLKQAWGI